MGLPLLMLAGCLVPVLSRLRLGPPHQAKDDDQEDAKKAHIDDPLRGYLLA